MKINSAEAILNPDRYGLKDSQIRLAIRVREAMQDILDPDEGDLCMTTLLESLIWSNTAL